MEKTQRIVILAALVTLGSTTASSFMPEKFCGRGELPSPRLLFGTALSFAGLSILADFAPKIAGLLSVSIGMTALTYYGLPVMDAVFTGKECKPANNGRNGNNTFQLPASGAGTGGEFGIIPLDQLPRDNANPTVPNQPGGNQPARPSF